MVKERYGESPTAELRWRKGLKATSARLDLTDLNYNARQTIYDEFARNTLNMPEIVEQLGTPGISLPTSSPYNTFGRYFVNPQLEAGQRNSSGTNVIDENFCQH